MINYRDYSELEEIIGKAWDDGYAVGLNSLVVPGQGQGYGDMRQEHIRQVMKSLFGDSE